MIEQKWTQSIYLLVQFILNILITITNIKYIL